MWLGGSPGELNDELAQVRLQHVDPAATSASFRPTSSLIMLLLLNHTPDLVLCRDLLHVAQTSAAWRPEHARAVAVRRASACSSSAGSWSARGAVQQPLAGERLPWSRPSANMRDRACRRRCRSRA